MAHAGGSLDLAALRLAACGSECAAFLDQRLSGFGSPAHRIGFPISRRKIPPRRCSIFTKRQLAQNGVHKEARGGGEYGGFLSAADESHSRNVMIEIRSNKGTSEVNITLVQKK